MKPNQYFMKFDNCIKFGSPEHYFHFMWGYLLPAVNQIIKIEENYNNFSETRNRYIFRSCGPVMDIVLNEFLQLHNINYAITKQGFEDKISNSKIFVPRWDLWLIDLKNHHNFRSLMQCGKINLNLRCLVNLFAGINASIFPKQLVASIHRIRKEVYSKLNFESNELFKKFLGKYLLIKRSPQPEYYNKGGKAEIPTYGSNRRKLIRIAAVAEELKKNNIPVEIFQPGKHSLEDQIQAFKACEGAIGIIGAEFSNLIWMESNKKVFILTPMPVKNLPLVFPTLAKLLGHYCCEIVPRNNSMNIEFNDEIIIIPATGNMKKSQQRPSQICYI